MLPKPSPPPVLDHFQSLHTGSDQVLEAKNQGPRTSLFIVIDGLCDMIPIPVESGLIPSHPQKSINLVMFLVNKKKKECVNCGMVW